MLQNAATGMGMGTSASGNPYSFQGQAAGGGVDWKKILGGAAMGGMAGMGNTGSMQGGGSSNIDLQALIDSLLGHKAGDALNTKSFTNGMGANSMGGMM